MLETSIITGRVNLTVPTNQQKSFYIKVFPGLFSLQAPTPKKAKILVGELIVKYSGRQWPEKKNGKLVGNMEFILGIIQLLKDLELNNAADVSWHPIQRDIKETVTVKVGTKLAKELVQRGIVTPQ